MLTAIAGFAEAFASPVTLAVVLAMAFLLPHASWLRLAAVAVAPLLALPGLLPAPPPFEATLIVLGAVAASLLYAEIAIHFVLPACRLAWRMVRAAWRLCGEAAAILLDPGPRRAADPAGADEPGTAKKEAKLLPPIEPEP